MVQIFHEIKEWWKLLRGKADDLHMVSDKLQDEQGGQPENPRKNRYGNDSLTGVADRKNFENTLNRFLTEEHRAGCLLKIDVDRMREINHIYGQDAGNNILCRIAELLSYVFGRNGCIGRTGGDEFALWLPESDYSGRDDIRTRIGIINDRLLHPQGALPPVTISAGAAFSTSQEDLHSVVRHAGEMLKQVKEQGRCGCEIYDG